MGNLHRLSWLCCNDVDQLLGVMGVMGGLGGGWGVWGLALSLLALLYTAIWVMG